MMMLGLLMMGQMLAMADDAIRCPRDEGHFQVEATAYTAECEGCIGITADGTDVRETILGPDGLGVIAADTRYHPFGTVFEVEMPDGQVRKYVVRDRGAAIKGPLRIDILMADRDEAIQFGRRDLRVRLKE